MGVLQNIDIFRVHYRFVALDCSVAVNIDAGKCPVRHTDLHDCRTTLPGPGPLEWSIKIYESAQHLLTLTVSVGSLIKQCVYNSWKSRGI